MQKRAVFLSAILSLMPLGQPLLIKTGVVLSTAGLMLSVSEKVNADSAIFYLNRGNEKYRLGEYYSAISLYNKAIKLNPKDADIYYNRGNAKRKINDYEGAISDYDKAIKLNPEKSNFFVNRGISKQEFGDKKGACKDYKFAASIGVMDLAL